MSAKKEDKKRDVIVELMVHETEAYISLSISTVKPLTCQKDPVMEKQDREAGNDLPTNLRCLVENYDVLLLI